MLKILVFIFATMCATTARAAENAPPAGPLQLSLSGYTTWYVAGSYNDRTPVIAGVNTDYNRFDVMGDAEIYFEGTANLTDTLKIGVMAQLEGGTDDYSENWDEVYMFVQNDYGKLLIGNMRNVSFSMTVAAPSVSVLGAEWTFYTRQVVNPGVVFVDSTDSKDIDSLAPKLSYISPSVNGFALGLSVMGANNTLGHDATVLYPKNTPALFDDDYLIKHGGLALLRYDGDFENDVSLSASAYYGVYKPNMAGLSHVEQDFGVGAKIATGAFSFGASYRRILADADSLFRERQGYVLDVGAVYDAKTYAVSANYFRSQTRGLVGVDGKDRVNMYILAGKYRLGAGIDAFVDVGYIEYKDETGLKANENKGVGSAVGFSLAF